MSHPFLLSQHDDLPRAAAGGKGAGLGRLLRLGLDVPAFLVLTAEAYRQSCPDHRLPEVLPAEVEAALDVAWTDLATGDSSLAVRSSAVEEDGSERSYAGQMETFLNVTDRPGLSIAVLGCWRSLHGERATAYRAAAATGQESGTTDCAMAVVVQQQVQPDAAGVLFTVNPISGADDELLVNAVHGLGEGLVAGLLNADVFVLAADGSVKSRQLVDQQEMLIADPTGGTRRVPLPAERNGTPTLDDGLLADLAGHALNAADAAGHPLDIEFAVAEGRLYFLQARAVTGFVARHPPGDAPRLVWDNANINESYPGHTSPLTFSFIRRAYRAVYWQFCRLLGLSEKRVAEHEDMLANMLGLHRGQVYYHLLNWYRLVSLMPGYRYNRKFMEGMMGVGQSLDQDEAPLPWWRRYFVELPRLVRVGLRCVHLQRTLPRRIARFHEQFRKHHAHFAGLDYANMDPSAILARYRAMEEAVLWNWQAPIINDFSVMIFYGLLQRLTVTWGVDADGALHNALVAQQGDIDSTQVADRLLAIARRLADNEDLGHRFAAATPAESIAILAEDPGLQADFDRYLADFGDRCIEELKLESRTMSDDPGLCLAMLQNQVRLVRDGQLPDRDPQDTTPEPSAREAAEQVVVTRLQGRRGKFGLPLLGLYRFVLRQARAGIRNRENQRLARTRAFAVVRRMFRAIGAHWFAAGRLDTPEDVFYLDLDELHAAADDPDLDLRSRVAERRARYDRWRGQPPLPNRFETHGLTGPDGEPARVHQEPAEGPVAPGALCGLGAFPGQVERPAIVLTTPDPSVRLAGEILVTRQTDPGWVLLFHGISGLVVERGSMLSHSAIVAREMRIPTVVGVTGAANRINTGDVLRLDGGAGTVEILTRSREDDA